MSDFQKIDGSKLDDNELILQSLRFGYKINKMNRIPIFDILKSVFDIDEDRRDIIVATIVHHKIAKYGDNDENDLLMNIDGIKAIQTDNPIAYMEKLEADKNKPRIDNSINVGGNMTGSQVGHSSEFGDLRNKLIVESIADANTKNSNQKSKFDLKLLVQYLAWFAGITSAIIALWKFFT